MPLPDFLIVGAPKAGSTALHAALVRHPDLFLSVPKEPKFFLTGGTRPARAGQRGPGDAHSAQEWVWRAEDYEALFAAAPPGRLKGESTPFYLWSREAHLRIAAAVPHVKAIAVVRDPVERAYSNWTHLWADGLEPEHDFLTACALEPQRVAAGWAPFWRYLELGRYGEQLEHLLTVLPREQVLVIRYRDVVDAPKRTLDRVCGFLGVRTGLVTEIPPSNVGRWAADSPRNARLRRLVRAGAAAGAHVPPQVWRSLEHRVLRRLQHASGPRPRLDATTRVQLIEHFRDDITVLERVTGDGFHDWLGEGGVDTYTLKQA